MLATEMIASALKKHPAKVTAIVPFYAMSSGTMIALAANEIVMEEFSVLGALEPQIHGMASGATINLVAKKPIASVSDAMFITTDLAQNAIKEVRPTLTGFSRTSRWTKRKKRS